MATGREHAAQRIREQTMTLEHGRTRYTRGCDCDAYYCGGLGEGGTGRGRGVFCPQFRPTMQSQPRAWGWTASSQQTSSGDEGVETTSVDEGSAVVYGTPAPPTPPSARASTAEPPHAAAIVLPVRFAITPNFDFSALNVQSRNVLCCTRRVFVACESRSSESMVSMSRIRACAAWHPPKERSSRSTCCPVTELPTRRGRARF
jgi:hypothetical protein